MTNEEIKELIRMVQETGIAELEVQNGDSRVRIRSAHGAQVQDVMTPGFVVAAPAAIHPAMAAVHPGMTAGAAAVLPAQERSLPQSEALDAVEEAATTVVKSPIVGTYYDSPSPDAPPFVKVGDHVHAKQVLCIIESMKLMNEIEAEVSGTIVAKLVANGRPVEYGESLFSIRTA